MVDGVDGERATERAVAEGMKIAADSFLRRTLFDIPRRRSIDRRHGNLGLGQRFNNAGERLPDFAGEAKAENSVDNMVRRLEGGREIIHKRDLQVI